MGQLIMSPITKKSDWSKLLIIFIYYTRQGDLNKRPNFYKLGSRAQLNFKYRSTKEIWSKIILKV